MSALRPAVEYNVGRKAWVEGSCTPALVCGRAVDSTGRRLLSGTAQRVLAMLIGLWLSMYDSSCKPLRGQHAGKCPHRQNVTPFSPRHLADELSGQAGGSQLAMVNRALEELARATCEYHVLKPSGARLSEVSHVLSLRSWELSGRHESSMGSAGYIAWDPFLLHSLLLGSVQTIPIELLRRLSREAEVQVWMRLLNHPRTAKLVPGMSHERAVTGRHPTLPASLLGLGGQRPDKLASSLDRITARGNAVQNWYGAEVLPRLGGGLKLRLTLIRSVRHSGTHSAAHWDAEDGSSGPTARQYRTPFEHESLPPEEYREDLQEENRDDPSGRDDVAALQQHWGRRGRVTQKQAAVLDEIASRHGGPEWAASVIRSTPKGEDPLKQVFEAERRMRTGIRRAEESAKPRPLARQPSPPGRPTQAESHDGHRSDSTATNGVQPRPLRDVIGTFEQVTAPRQSGAAASSAGVADDSTLGKYGAAGERINGES